MNTLDRYVGRIVRLKPPALLDVARRGKRGVEPLDNCFLVAAVSREMRKLICYGANLRIAVGAGDVVLISWHALGCALIHANPME